MSARSIEGSVALVTGAGRGLGRALVDALLDRDADRVYAGARKIESLNWLRRRWGDRVVGLQLDVTLPQQVANAVAVAPDVELLLNSAAVICESGDELLARADAVEDAECEMDVNALGLLRMTRAFAPVLAHNGGGAVVNVLSLGGLTGYPFLPGYSASKAAAHNLTQSLRALLRGQGTLVAGAFPGPIETDRVWGIDIERTTFERIAHAILDGLEEGREEIYPDRFAERLARRWRQDPRAAEAEMSRWAGWDRERVGCSPSPTSAEA